MLLPAAVEKSELKATVLHLWFGEYRDCFFRTIVAARYLQELGLSAKIALGGTVIAGSEIPNVQDEVPVLAVAAAFADGVTEIRDAAELTRKESDRIRTVHSELRALGVAAEANAEGLVVRGGGARSAVLRSHGDHRVAMAMAVAANAMDAPSTVREWSAVSSSYPDFAADLGRLTGVS